MGTIYENRISKHEAVTRLSWLLAEIAKHLGKPVDGQANTYADVLAFIEQAVHNEIAAESQQARELDALDREV